MTPSYPHFTFKIYSKYSFLFFKYLWAFVILWNFNNASEILNLAALIQTSQLCTNQLMSRPLGTRGWPGLVTHLTVILLIFSARVGRVCRLFVPGFVRGLQPFKIAGMLVSGFHPYWPGFVMMMTGTRQDQWFKNQEYHIVVMIVHSGDRRTSYKHQTFEKWNN